jgi:hypothetical protein
VPRVEDTQANLTHTNPLLHTFPSAKHFY